MFMTKRDKNYDKYLKEMRDSIVIMPRQHDDEITRMHHAGWLQKQLDSVAKTVDGWSDSKKIASGVIDIKKPTNSNQLLILRNTVVNHYLLGDTFAKGTEARECIRAYIAVLEDALKNVSVQGDN